MKSFFFLLSLAGLGLLALGACPRAQALDEPVAFTLDLPFQANAATPMWLGHPVVPNRAFATLDLPIMPPDATSSLLVTVFFTEKEGGFLRITWQGGTGVAQVLSNNFYEGTEMSNQRSLLIPSETLSGEGTLDLQCSDATLSIQRVRLEWLENKNGLVSPHVDDLLVTPSTGQTVQGHDLDGEPPTATSAAWHGQVVTVPISDTPQRIEAGVEFNVQLDSLPTAGRLALKEEGLLWGKHLTVWVNQQRAGTITPGVPDLLDDGFFSDPASSAGYIGWRDGSLYLPVNLLKVGVNAIQFSAEDEIDATPATTTTPDPATIPLAVKNVIAQFVYPPAAGTPAPVSAPESAPADTNLPTATPPTSSSP